MKKSSIFKLIICFIMLGGYVALAVANTSYSQGYYSSTEEFTVTNDEGTPIAAKAYFPLGFDSSSSGIYPAIIVSHGDVEWKEMMHYYAVEMVKREWVIVTYDFPNHGQSGVDKGSVGEVN
ncbi:MAG: hypothetical protein ACFFCS_30065, partial [Candidatus Hodarchaeota archaeon]